MSKPVRMVGSRPAQPSRVSVVKTQAIFGFFQPKPAVQAGPDPRGKELAEEVQKLCVGTDYGSKASPQRKEAIAKAVVELSKYCIKNPLKSPLLWGEYEVLYSSKPSAVGGPLRQGPGPTVFPGQNARQILQAPNKLINQVDFKTLGFVPGFSKQFGEIQPVGADTFVLNITSGELKAGLGAPQKKEFNIQRKIQILYLDEELRVARFIPSAELEDDEAAANGGKGSEEIIFVFKRAQVKPSASKSTDEDEEEEEEDRVPKTGTFMFGAKSKSLSVATVAERQARAAMKAPTGTARVGGASGTRAISTPPARSAPPARAPSAPAPGTSRSRSDLPPARPGTLRSVPVGSQRSGVAVGSQARPGSTPVRPAGTRAVAAAPVKAAPAKAAPAKKGAKAEEVDPREQRRREQEELREARARLAAEEKAAKAKAADDARKAAEAKAAKEKQEAEKRAAVERAAAVKEQLARLGEELKQRAAEARKALADFKDLEKGSVSQLKKVAAAKAQVQEAESDVAEVEEKLGQASASRKEVEAKVKEAAAALAAAQKELSTKLVAAGPKLGRK